MSRLVHDRYLAYDRHRACDLVTGQYLSLESLIADDDPNELPLPQLAELLNHGRDGGPRWVVAEAANSAVASGLIRRAAADGRRHGYVAISVETYLRFRDTLHEELGERTLLLIGGFTAVLSASRHALLSAAARSPRPHLLLTFKAAAPMRPVRHLGTTGAPLVREARAVYAVNPRLARSASAFMPEVERQVARAQHADVLILAGLHAAAERLLRDVSAALERRDAFSPAAGVVIRLGRLLLERGRSSTAESEFGRAASLEESTGDDEGMRAARVWQAAARTDCGRLVDAESICRAVLAASHSAPRRTWIDAVLARVLLWQGRVEEAAARDLTGAEDPGPYDATSAWIDSVAVRVALAVGRIFEAGQRVQSAVDSSQTINDPLTWLIVRTAQLRVLTAAGDLNLARKVLDEIETLARRAHAPLRVARGRLILAAAFRRAGRMREAQQTLDRLQRMRRALPPLLQQAVEKAERDAPMSSAPSMLDGTSSSISLALIRLGHEEEDDIAALRQLLEYVAREMQASRAEIVSCDAGPTTVVASVGAGLSTHLGTRVLEAGIVIGPECHESAPEIGLPVRLGSKVVAGLVCRWPADRTPRSDAKEVLALVAAIAAPRVEAMISGARDAVRVATSIPELVGVSTSLVDLRKTIARAASAPFTVLIEGESGVGKELVARAIHQLGPRRERRFCDVNCAALPEELLESELFGHARGAFTGAVADRAGLFEEADGGTLFLDELADLSLRAQAKLLRVLQQHEVRRVGEAFGRKIDVRLIAAANRDMWAEATHGRFRQDLLYRLDVIRVRILPLRDRPEDIPVLAQQFWREAAARVQTGATLSHGVLAALARYHWPGNVRELQNVLAALAVAAPVRGVVRSARLPAAVVGATSVTSGKLADAREQFERRFVEAALARAAGSRTRAARELGLSRQGLLKLMLRLGLSSR